MLHASGSPSPDSTGDYLEVGIVNGEPSYTNSGVPDWHMWYDGAEWLISPIMGVSIGIEWFSASKLGTYTGRGGYTGTLTVSQ